MNWMSGGGGREASGYDLDCADDRTIGAPCGIHGHGRSRGGFETCLGLNLDRGRVVMVTATVSAGVVATSTSSAGAQPGAY
jgi:hypothetical protein